MYKPKSPFITPMYVCAVDCTTLSKGIPTKQYAEPTKNDLFYGSFKSYGGTETTVNGVYSIIDTATVETWYRPDIRSNCCIRLAETGAMYEIIGEPENLEMRNIYLRFKVRRVKGGA